MLCILPACGKGNEEKNETSSSNKFNTKVALTVAENYLNLLAKEDYENASKLYSKSLKDKNQDFRPGDLRIVGFNQDTLNEVGESILVRYRVTRVVKGEARSDLDNCSIKIIKEGTDYKISEVKSENEKEAYVEGKSLRQRRKDEVKSSPIIRLHRLPREMYPKSNKANFNKVPIPNKEFTAVNFSYSGEKIALSTFNEDSFIGIVGIDDSLQTAAGGQSGGAGGQQGGQQGGAQGEGGQQGEDISMEKPIGQKILSLDILKNAKVDYMVFSRDEKVIMVEFTEKGKGSSLNLYETDNGNLVELDIDKKYPSDKYDVVFVSFDKNVMTFEVKAKKGQDLQDPAVGKYQVDLEKFKVKKL